MFRRAVLLLLSSLLGGCLPSQTPPLQEPASVRKTPFPARRIEVRGLSLRCVVQGKGPSVFLIPGHTSRIEELDAVTAALDEDFQVAVCDFPGSGYSEKPIQDYSVDYYAEIAIEILDTLEIPRTHWVGGSLGGNLALRLAARWPERTEKVVAWNPGSAWRARPYLAAFLRPFTGRVFFWPMVWIQSRYWFSPDWPGRSEALRETFRYYEEVRSPGFIRMYWGIALDTLGRSLYDIAPKVEAPTALIWGTRDTTPEMGPGIERIVASLPRGRRIEIDGPHCLAVERLEPLVSAIRDFLLEPRP